ncbi:hypothetical protein [Halosegnis longus]|uniref:hypothetical protein n=1 Tax=Halosegnis longus TaxID=2216012 RepID=UPI001314CCB2
MSLVKLALSGVVLMFAVPGLVIEPGPISEIVAVGALGTIWGIDLGLGGGDD